MLSERGLQIVEKLIDNNRKPITSKTLALYLGVSERSVKTYIKEVSDFCKEHQMVLERKPGIGFVADFSDEQIEEINDLKRDKKIVMSKKQRMCYIMYILLSGWDTYTLSLFSEELNVSKKVISDDISSISKELDKYNIKINRVAGHGVFITGNEFSIRKAMKSFCLFSIGNTEVNTQYDYRMSAKESETWINNFGRDNFEKAVQTVTYIERKYGISYTDYSFRMIVQYLCIQLFRIRMGNVIEEPILNERNNLINDNILNDIVDKLSELSKVEINEYERQYIDIVFAGVALQEKKEESGEDSYFAIENNPKEICAEILEYLSEILNVDLFDNELLCTGLEGFIPASFIRTKFGLEVINPFMEDIREMYSGIFAVCFTLGKFYEKYAGRIPTDQELSFLALFVGGALHRNEKTVNAVLVGTSGPAASSIVAKKIENRIDSINIVAILSGEKINTLEDYEFDIVLSMVPSLEYEDKVVYITPVVSKVDEKNIKDKCFEILSHPEVKKEGFSRMIDPNHILFIQEKAQRDSILRRACNMLYENGYVKEEFYHDVIRREKIEPTAIGNGVAIPHGTPENVIEPKVFVIRLAYPVSWGDKMVDTIFLLALNFNNITTTKVFFHDFARILGNAEKVKKIRNTANIAEIEKTLKEELHWN